MLIPLLYAATVVVAPPLVGDNVIAAAPTSVGVKSYGQPYFAYVQNDTTSMVIGIAGERTMRLEIAFDQLPVRLAADDEEHIVFSLHNTLLGAQEEILAIGLTPAGALFAKAYGSNKAITQIGLIVPAPEFHSIEVVAASAMILNIDGANVASVDLTGSPLGPLRTRFMLFNGVRAATRCACTIRQASYGDEEIQIDWDVSEGSGSVIHGAHTQEDDEFYSLLNPDLTAQWYDPSPLPLLYGPVPGSNPSSGFRWENKTRYACRECHRPEYRRVTQ